MLGARQNSLRRAGRSLRLERLSPRCVLTGLAPLAGELSIVSSVGVRHPIPESPAAESLPWSTLEKFEFVATGDESIRQDDLLIRGVINPDVRVAGFDYDAVTGVARWTFNAPLPSDRYIVNVRGPLANGGPFLDDSSTLRFDVLIGDVDGDGETSVVDLASVENAANASVATAGSMRWDINADGVIDGLDVATVRDHLGRLPLHAVADQITSVSVGDRDGNGFDELVSLQSGTESRLTLHHIHPQGSDVSASVRLSDAFHFTHIEAIAGDNPTDASVAVMGVHRSTGGLRVWIWDLQSSTPTRSIAFNRPGIGRDMVVYRDPITDRDRIAVLVERPDLDRSRIHTADLYAAATDQSWHIGNGYAAKHLRFLPASGDEPSAWVVAGVVPATGGVRVKVFDAATGQQRSNRSFGRVDAVDFIATQNQAGQRWFAILRRYQHATTAVIDIRSSTNNEIHIRSLPGGRTPIGMSVIPSDDETGDPQLAVLSMDPIHRRNVVDLVDIAGSVVRSDNFGSGGWGDAITVGRFADDAAAIVAQRNEILGTSQLQIRSTDRAARVVTVAVQSPATLPLWFESNRVHGHTRLSMVDPRFGLERSYHDTFESDSAAEVFNELGASVFTRHALTMDEDPWWPSQYSVDNADLSFARENRGIELEAGENLVQAFIDSAWAEAMPMMAYYFDITDAAAASAHPDWLCRTHDGDVPSHTYKGEYLDITGPYGDIIAGRVLELADMGAAGVYLDFRHMPAGGCWGSQLEIDFTAATGLPAPPIGNADTYQTFIEFAADRMTQTIDGWRQTVTKQYPSFQFIVSVTSVPALTRSDMHTNLTNVGNPKSEFTVAVRRGQSNSVFTRNPDLYQPDNDVRMAMGFALLRDAADGGMPHIWNAIAPNGDHLRSFVAAVTAYGAIAALDVAEELFDADGYIDGLVSRVDVASGFDLGNRISPHLSGTQADRWAAVLFSESIRNKRNIDSLAAWSEVLLPTVGVFETVQRSRRPIGVLTDSTLTRGDANAYKVLVIPNPAELTADMQLRIDAFVAGGGELILADPSWDWSTAAGYHQAMTELNTRLDAVADQPRITAPDLNAGIHVLTHRRDDTGSTVVSILNHFDYAQSFTLFDPPSSDQVNPTPPPIPPGSQLHMALASNDLRDYVVYEAVRGEWLPVERTVDGLKITLPSIDAMVVIEIREMD